MALSERLASTWSLARALASRVDADDREAQAMLADAAKDAAAATAALARGGAPADVAKARGRWVKAHLDATFVQESLVATGERPITRDELDMLVEAVRVPADAALAWAAPSAIAADSAPAAAKAMVEVFDADVAEAVLWRLGALHYMYASTNCPRGDLNRQPDCALETLADGARYLQAMLEVRAGFRYPAIGNPAEATAPSMIVAAATDAEQDPARLVDEGLYASTNVLAIMYLAELLGWLHDGLAQSPARWPAARPLPDRARVRLECLGLLQQFLRLLQTSLAGTGWSYERALAIWRRLDAAGFARDGAAVNAALKQAASATPFILRQ